MVFLKEFFKKVDIEKNQQTTTKKKHKKFPRMQRVVSLLAYLVSLWYGLPARATIVPPANCHFAKIVQLGYSRWRHLQISQTTSAPKLYVGLNPNFLGNVEIQIS